MTECDYVSSYEFTEFSFLSDVKDLASYYSSHPASTIPPNLFKIPPKASKIPWNRENSTEQLEHLILLYGIIQCSNVEHI